MRKIYNQLFSVALMACLAIPHLMAQDTKQLEDNFTGGISSMPTYFGDAVIPSAKWASEADFTATSQVTGATYTFGMGCFISGTSKAMVVPFGPTSVYITMPAGCTQISMYGEASAKSVRVTVTQDGNTLAPMDFTEYQTSEEHVMAVEGGKTYCFTNPADRSTNWWLTKVVYTVKEGGTTAQGVISGAVKDPAGNALNGANVSILKDGNKVGTGVTGEDGTYSINVPDAEGSFSVEASLKGYFPETLKDLTIENGQRDNCDLTLVPTIFKGQITTGETPLFQAMVIIKDAAGKTAGMQVTDEEGNFAFDHVLAYDGSYKVTFGAAGYESIEQELTFNAETKEPIIANVSLVKEEILVLLSGNVFVGDDRMPGVNITLFDGPNAIGTATTDEDGFYTIQVANPEGDSYLVSGVKEGYWTAYSEPFGFNYANVEEKDLNLRPTVLKGVVKGNGEPLANVEIKVKVADEVVAQTTSNAAGEYEFIATLPCDKAYFVEFTAENYEVTVRQFEFDQTTQAEMIMDVDMSQVGIDEMTSLIPSRVLYYDLAGRQVVNPQRGIFIRKAGNKVTKIIL